MAVSDSPIIAPLSAPASVQAPGSGEEHPLLAQFTGI